MVPQVTLDDAQLALAYLLNQNTIPQGEAARRAFFIASGVQRLYRAFDFDMARQFATITTDDSGLGDVTDLNLGPLPAIESISDGIRTYSFIFGKDATDYSQGDFRYWLILNEDAEWELHTTEPSTDLTLTYYDAPDIGTANAAVIFTKMLIGKASLIYYRQAQDQDADTSVEEDSFRQEVSETIEAQNRRRPQRFATTQRDIHNHYIGRT